MKTRVISTEIWDEDKVFSLNIDTKLLYLVLLTNPYIGQTRYYKINDRQLSTFTGLNVEQIQKCKKDLAESEMAYFKNGWVCISGFGFIECFYKGIKNEKAKIKELEKIPDDVLSYFNSVSIPYPYPSDTTINTKSEIINTKSEIKKEDFLFIDGNLTVERLEDKVDFSVQKESRESKRVRLSEEYETSFQEFWRIYPEKVAKGKAYEVWKLLTAEIKQTCIEAIKNQVENNHFYKEWKKEDVPPHPTTWLNQRRWEDAVKKINKDEILKVVTV